jgi:hypothetical protein
VGVMPLWAHLEKMQTRAINVKVFSLNVKFSI